MSKQVLTAIMMCGLFLLVPLISFISSCKYDVGIKEDSETKEVKKKEIIFKNKREENEQKTVIAKRRKESKEKWSNINTNYVYKIIYVSGGKKAPFKQIINEYKNRYKGKDLNLKFFDNLENTPSRFPWTERQNRHHIASYLYRRELGIDRFSFIKNGSRYDVNIEINTRP
jgi:hypothetical protein